MTTAVLDSSILPELAEPAVALPHDPTTVARPGVLGWIANPDHYVCHNALPGPSSVGIASIVDRVRERAATHPRLILPMVGGWMVVVFGLQMLVQPAVAKLLWPVVVPTALACGVAIARLHRGLVSPARAWQAVSVASCIQAVTCVIAYFLTGVQAYEFAVVIQVLAVGVFDVRGRAGQLMASVVVISWTVATVISPMGEESIWNLVVIVGACSAALVGQSMLMRTIYTAEWLRTIDETRSDQLSDALTDTHTQLRYRLRAERKLEKMVVDLQSAQAHLLQAHKLQAIGQLAAGVAHEINTPTQYVTDNTTFLQGAFDKLVAATTACRTAVEESSTPAAELAREALKRARLDYHIKQVPRAIDQSLDGLRRIGSLVGALKEFSHPSGGAKAAVDLNRSIETTITIARNEWKYVAEVTTDLDPELPPVWCLGDELNQVVLNMIVNAAHALGERTDGQLLGKIVVSTRASGDHAVIQITDDGAGIPEDIRHRIFEPFFTTKPVGKGTGQGLAISYAVIVDKHQGTIELDSEVGRGTTFTIRIPIAAADAIAA